MSTTPELQQQAASVTPDAPSTTLRPPRRLLVGIAAGVVAVGAVAGAAVALLRAHGDAVVVTGALRLPDQLGTQHPVPSADDLTQSPDWTSKAAAQLGGAAYVARTFGTDPKAPTTRVVVAKTDLTGKLELGWAADRGTEFGDVRCTQNVNLGARVGVRPTLSLCWRTGPTLSAYALVIDVDHAVRVDAAAAAVRDAWATMVP